MPRKPVFVESMTRVTLGLRRDFVVRVWSDWKGASQGVIEQEVVRAYEFGLTCFDEVESIFERVGELKGVTAIEVVDRHGNGQVRYYDW